MAALHRSPPQEEDLPLPLLPALNEDGHIDARGGAPKRYLPLHRVYSSTAPRDAAAAAAASSNVMSKKVRARKLLDHFGAPFDDIQKPPPSLPPPSPSPSPLMPTLHTVYSRKRSRPRPDDHQHTNPPMPLECLQSPPQPSHSRGSDLTVRSPPSHGHAADDVPPGPDCGLDSSSSKKRRTATSELTKLGIDDFTPVLQRPRLRENRHQQAQQQQQTRKHASTTIARCSTVSSSTTKRWTELNCHDADPKAFVGLRCKVFWLLDGDWYLGHVVGYNLDTNQHHVQYEDGDEEYLIISKEKLKFQVSQDDMQRLNLFCGTGGGIAGLDYDEMIVLAATLQEIESQEIQPGDIVWAKLTGHAMWPAIVVDESLVGYRKALNRVIVGRSVPVQFFGTHDFARVKPSQAISFLQGLLSSFHLKCKKPHFFQSLEEAKQFLRQQKLPERMVEGQKAANSDDCGSATGEDEKSSDSLENLIRREDRQIATESFRNPILQFGKLKILSIGKIVNTDYLLDGKYICPEGYTALRQYTSIADPGATSIYKMEVIGDAESKMCPMFKVTSDNGLKFEGSSPSACWDKVYKIVREIKDGSFGGPNIDGGVDGIRGSGSDMFGLSKPEIQKYIEDMLIAPKVLPASLEQVDVNWKDLDKCSVCHMDEEYENNLFLQCDECRMMVHARCFGESEPADGVLWLCNLCRPGAPDFTPLCCLCPVKGGAMKPTTDGRWAHLACAIWIPETCLSDIKAMEPIDGLSRINKARWRLLCCICYTPYGACIQCSDNTCRVAYHPLCARAAGFCFEVEDESRLDLMSVGENEEEQCIRLLSFCKKHRQPSSGRPAADRLIGPTFRPCSKYIPPSNHSGCARSEPYNYIGRRGRQEPEALEAASLKRLFVENRPYIVSGHCQHESSNNLLSIPTLQGCRLSSKFQKLKTSAPDDSKNILSMHEKYKHMAKTYRKRLAFGKSGIHGFGIFAKYPHRAGDMVIEYTGELVRPLIADWRERCIYNSIVGAGTYMFRNGDERVIDATRAGSIAHLINHSCEPNCYSRVINVNHDEHIIIFAKRDIRRGEELTYDYRFSSIDKQLPCYCGFPSCRGVVNNEPEAEVTKLYVPRAELVVCKRMTDE